MKIFTIQDITLDTSKVQYAQNRCNYKEAKSAYHKLYKEYRLRYECNYKSFFWGFSKIIPKRNSCEYYPDILKRLTKISFGVLNKDIKKNQVLILEVPDEYCIATDFYAFNDVILNKSHNNLNAWNRIYTLGGVTQVIYPFISPDMIICNFNPSELNDKLNWSDKFEDQIGENLSSFFY